MQLVRVNSVALYHLTIPFKGEFAHSKQVRSASDTILVKIVTDAGTTGWGEVLAREYVTGETVEGIMMHDGEVLAEAVIGQRFENQAQITQWLFHGLRRWQHHLAILGGIELALWQCLEQEHCIDTELLIGPLRKSAQGRCVTIGFDASFDDLRARAIDSKLKKSTVVKMKVGLGVECDTRRLQTISAHLKHQMPLRIDGNGAMVLADALELMNFCKDLPIQSFEQPFNSKEPDLDESLRDLHKRSGIPLVADECVCSVEQAERWASNGSYQIFNVRLGKHGGMVGSRLIRDCALNNGIGLVAGSMVGESGVLTQASTLFVSRSDSLPYVEGLGQNRSFLSIDPVERVDENADTFGKFRLRYDQCEQFVQSSSTYQ